MFSGSLVAIVTPMTADGGLDWPAWDRLLDFHVREGTDGIVVAGTTGESPVLPLDEIEELTRRAVARCGGKLKVIVGAGTQLHGEHGRPHARAVAAGRRRRHAGDPVLQQAAAGGSVPAFHGGGGRLGGAGDPVQRAEPHRGRPAAGAPWRGWRGIRRSSRSRRRAPRWAACAILAAVPAGFRCCPAMMRPRSSSSARAPGGDFGDRQCGAAAHARGLRGGAARRLAGARAIDADPAAAAPGLVRRGEPDSGEMGGCPHGPDGEHNPPAAGRTVGRAP